MTKAIKKAKKANPKDIAKKAVMDIFTKALEEAGLTYEDGVEFGMTKGTIVVHFADLDVQIKPIAPKAGQDKYLKVEYEEEV